MNLQKFGEIIEITKGEEDVKRKKKMKIALALVLVPEEYFLGSE